ncbi:MAG: tetratricopeptide repeat protein, partial [Deltaproteobacteria bacterium]|nr:tetratricopeptide repeat protein [Deltaproteobacteria bacterium]
PEHPSSLRARFNLAKLAQQLGQHAEAVTLLAEGLAMREAEVADDDPKLRGWLDALGTSELALERPEAAEHLERALKIRTAQGAEDPQLARPRFALARALATQDLARARALAATAHGTLPPTPSGDQPRGMADPAQVLRAEIEAWLSAHPAAEP